MEVSEKSLWTVRSTLTFDPGKDLLFFASEKVNVNELLGNVGSFRCWPNREVEPSCITITYEMMERSDDKINFTFQTHFIHSCMNILSEATQ